MIYLTRKAHFSAGHRLFNPDFTDEENERIFGACSNPNYHGHNYILEVTVVGEKDPKTGFVIDLKKLKDIIDENIISKVDHKNLNLEVDFLKGVIPTAENISEAFWYQLCDKIQGVKLYSIKLYETERNIVEFRG